MASDFHYPRLDKQSGSIRLLALAPKLSVEDNRLQCRLVISNIDATYEALSYMWGASDDLDLTIWVNDFRFPVRKNLYCALTALRTTSERFLWIDALCINQANAGEKGHQVGMMDLIYEKAKQVLVWLGYPDAFWTSIVNKDEESFPDNTAERKQLPAFDLIKSVVNSSKKPPGFDEWGYFRPYFRPKWSAHWKQLADLFTAPYWSRLWIVQEFGLASKLLIYYGTSSCEGKTFLAFRELLHSLPVWAARQDINVLFHASLAAPDIGISMKQIMDSQAMWTPYGVRYHEFGNGFESILTSCEEQFCAERRDKVYGVLRLPHDIEKDDIPIDYSISIPQLYERAISWSCRRARRSTYIDRFSRAIQRTLLGPLSLDDPPAEMFDEMSHEDKSMSFTQPDFQYEVNSVLIEQIWTIPLSKSWSETTAEDIKNSELLLNDGPEHLKSVDPLQWSHALEALWELDPTSVLDFKGGSGPKTAKLFLFKTSSGTRIGLGPHCLRDGDILCRLEGEHTVATCRVESNEHHFTGRAAIAPGDVGKRKADVAKHHPLWPPPDLDVYNGTIDNPTLVRTWRISIAMLQALTCPLKWRKS